MKKTSVILFSSLLLFASCEEVLNNDDLSTTDVVNGLKTALNIGTDSSTAVLSVEDGYYGNSLVKIPLPDEAEAILEKTEFIRKYSSSAADVIDNKMEDLRLAINRAAEDAASDAKPIFTDAITNLTIADGWAILNGEVPSSSKDETSFDSLAATKYLKQQTYSSLVDAYAPKMDASLDKKLIGDNSAKSIWGSITSNYNGFVNQYGTIASAAAKIAGKDVEFNEVNTDISEFVTEKALDGLFLKVGEQEKSIRKNPFQYVSDIIQNVFGSLTNVLASSDEE